MSQELEKFKGKIAQLERDNKFLIEENEILGDQIESKHFSRPVAHLYLVFFFHGHGDHLYIQLSFHHHCALWSKGLVEEYTFLAAASLINVCGAPETEGEAEGEGSQVSVIRSLKARLVEETRNRRRTQEQLNQAVYDLGMAKKANRDLKARHVAKQILWQASIPNLNF